MERVYNFSAGPSMLPLPVLEEAQKDLVNYKGTGMSVMEMSHRSKTYDAIFNDAMDTFRRVMKVPDTHKILFLQGGASTQFAAVPMNLMKTGKADYVVSGEFSGKAYKEAKKYGDVALLASSEDKNFSYIPAFTAKDVRPDADYVHVCYNNTIYGTHFNKLPDVGKTPLVADMSSCIMSEPCDFSKFALVYAGAQKNIGPAGLTVVVVDEAFLGNARKETPTMLDYAVMAEKNSLYNTPPCYAIYVAGLVFRYVEELGGTEEMLRRNRKKADLLYATLENTRLFRLHAEKESRSLMNVTFRTDSEELDKEFIAVCGENGLVSIAGHRKVGGMRASIYNAMPYEGVEKLCRVIEEFDRTH